MSSLTLSITPKKRLWIMVDGEPIHTNYSIDFKALFITAFKDGEYFIWTCGCSVPECAGIYEPVEVTTEDGKILWHITEPEPEAWYVFTKSDYARALHQGAMDVLAFLNPGRPDSIFGTLGTTRQLFVDYQEKLACLIHERAQGKD